MIPKSPATQFFGKIFHIFFNAGAVFFLAKMATKSGIWGGLDFWCLASKSAPFSVKQNGQVLKLVLKFPETGWA